MAADNTHASGVYVNDVNTAAIRTTPWTAVGLRAGWNGQVGAWLVSPFAGVLNASNERYAGSVVVNAGFNRYFEPAPPRNAYVGVEIRPAR
jgi:iron complex outermembrane receptor protein